MSIPPPPISSAPTAATIPAGIDAVYGRRPIAVSDTMTGPGAIPKPVSMADHPQPNHADSESDEDPGRAPTPVGSLHESEGEGSDGHDQQESAPQVRDSCFNGVLDVRRQNGGCHQRGDHQALRKNT